MRLSPRTPCWNKHPYEVSIVLMTHDSSQDHDIGGAGRGGGMAGAAEWVGVRGARVCSGTTSRRGRGSGPEPARGPRRPHAAHQPVYKSMTNAADTPEVNCRERQAGLRQTVAAARAGHCRRGEVSDPARNLSRRRSARSHHRIQIYTARRPIISRTSGREGIAAGPGDRVTRPAHSLSQLTLSLTPNWSNWHLTGIASSRWYDAWQGPTQARAIQVTQCRVDVPLTKRDTAEE